MFAVRKGQIAGTGGNELVGAGKVVLKAFLIETETIKFVWVLNQLRVGLEAAERGHEEGTSWEKCAVRKGMIFEDFAVERDCKKN
jgi:hypothetical protein